MSNRPARLATIRDRFVELVPPMVLLHERVAREVGLSSVELQVLHLLALAERPLAPSELSARAELPRSSMTRVLARLENAGYVRRSTVPEDGRRALIHIVPERAATVSERFDRYARAMESAGRRFTDEQLETIAEYWTAFSDELAADGD